MGRRILILYHMQNGHMDPGFPGFIYTQSGEYDSEPNPNTNLRGTLKILPLVKCIAEKMDFVIFLDDKKLVKNSKKNRASPLDRVPIEKLSITMKDIKEDDSLFFGGVVEKNSLELKNLFKNNNVTIIEEIVNVSDKPILNSLGGSILNLVDPIENNGESIIKLLSPFNS